MSKSEGKKDFLKGIKENIGRAYVFFGDEEYVKNSYMTKLQKQFEKNVGGADQSVFTEENFSIPVFLDEITNMYLGCNGKIITLRNVDTGALPAADKKTFFAEIAAASEEVLIIFHYDDMYLDTNPDTKKKRSDKIKELSKHAQPVETNKAGAGELLRWTKKHFESKGVNAEDNVISYLLSVTDNKMSALKGEIEKLAVYAEGQRLTKEDVDAVVSKSLEANVFEIVSSLTAFRYSEALCKLDICKCNRESTVQITTILGAALCELLYCKAAYDRGNVTVDDVLRDFGIRPTKKYFISGYLRNGRSYDIEMLKKAVLIMKETDILQKSSAVDGWILLDCAILEIMSCAKEV